MPGSEKEKKDPGILIAGRMICVPSKEEKEKRKRD